jgi:hypothetical protein
LGGYLDCGKDFAMRVLRLHEDAAGESHFETSDIALQLTDAAPPAKPSYFSSSIDADSCAFVRCPVGWDGQLHPAPRRQILVCLGGAMRITSSLGDARDLRPGTVLLVEDTNGKGHISEVTSDVAFEALVVRLA